MCVKANAHPLLTDKGDPLIFWAVLNAANQIQRYVYEFYMVGESVCGRVESGEWRSKNIDEHSNKGEATFSFKLRSNKKEINSYPQVQ